MNNLVQYYIVDAALGLRKGKIGAQCAHGALLADRVYQSVQTWAEANPEDSKSVALANQYADWFNGLMTKIVLKGDIGSMNWAQTTYGHMAATVVDAGFTEIPAGTTTVVVLPIMDKSEAPDWVRGLKLL